MSEPFTAQSPKKPEQIGIVGAGVMGSGIAEVAAASGFPTLLYDAQSEQVEAALARIRKNMQRQVERGRLSKEDAAQIADRIVPLNELEGFNKTDAVIEAATENEQVKLEIFRVVSQIVPEDALLASNTSSISITRIAAATAQPSRVIGIHFMNPPAKMKLVEVIRGLRTSEETFAQAVALAKAMGKEVQSCHDSPGFIVNRLLLPMINEAVYCLFEGVSSREEIDQAMRFGANHPMGPLALADLIGLDVCLSILEVMHSVFGDDKYRPCPLLRRYVDAGFLGRKSGRGFYTYE